MDERQEIINEIVELEWDFFQRVQNEGGRADCQDNYFTFSIMRRSQFRAWPLHLCRSYLEDLREAEKEGRNPLSEKYAYMMMYTDPAAFRKLEDRIPPVTEKKRDLVDRAAAIQVAWRLEYEAEYPKLSGKGRPVHSYEDGPYGVSFETYFKGEALTYGEETLAAFLEYTEKMRQEGQNMALEIMQYTVESYGYRSLREAEDAI